MQVTIVKVHVLPGSKNFSVVGLDEWTQEIKIKIKSKPNEGKANQELVTELRKMLSAGVKIISGQKSRHKTLLVEGSDDVVNKLVK